MHDAMLEDNESNFFEYEYEQQHAAE